MTPKAQPDGAEAAAGGLAAASDGDGSNGLARAERSAGLSVDQGDRRERGRMVLGKSNTLSVLHAPQDVSDDSKQSAHNKDTHA